MFTVATELSVEFLPEKVQVGEYATIECVARGWKPAANFPKVRLS